MPAYHSAFLAVESKETSGLAVLPIKSKSRGLAPLLDVAAPEEDIIEESIRLFRANALFRNFEVLGGADRTLIYLTFFIHQCIKKCEKIGAKAEGLRTLMTLSSATPLAPGDAGWPLSGHFPAPKTASEGEELRSYLKQLRETAVPKIVERIYNADGAPNKFWMQFAKRKFLNKEFP